VLATATARRDSTIAEAGGSLQIAFATRKRAEGMEIAEAERDFKLKKHAEDQSEAFDLQVNKALLEWDRAVAAENKKKGENDAQCTYERAVAEAEAAYIISVIESEGIGSLDLAESRAMDVRRDTNLRNARSVKTAALAAAHCDNAITILQAWKDRLQATALAEAAHRIMLQECHLDQESGDEDRQSGVKEKQQQAQMDLDCDIALAEKQAKKSEAHAKTQVSKAVAQANAACKLAEVEISDLAAHGSGTPRKALRVPRDLQISLVKRELALSMATAEHEEAMAHALFDREICLQEAKRRAAGDVSKCERNFKARMLEAEREHFKAMFVVEKGARAHDAVHKKESEARLMAARLAAEAEQKNLTDAAKETCVQSEARGLLEYGRKVVEAAAQHEISKVVAQTDLPKGVGERMKLEAKEKCELQLLVQQGEYDKRLAEINADSEVRKSRYRMEQEEVSCKLDVILADVCASGPGGNPNQMRKVMAQAEGKVALARAGHAATQKRVGAQLIYEKQLISLRTKGDEAELKWRQKERSLHAEGERAINNIKAAGKREVAKLQEQATRLESEIAQLAEGERRQALTQQLVECRGQSENAVRSSEFAMIQKMQEGELSMNELKAHHEHKIPGQIEQEIEAATEQLNKATMAIDEEFQKLKEETEAKVRTKMPPPKVRASTDPGPKRLAKRIGGLGSPTSTKNEADGDLPQILQDMEEALGSSTAR